MAYSKAAVKVVGFVYAKSGEAGEFDRAGSQGWVQIAKGEVLFTFHENPNGSESIISLSANGRDLSIEIDLGLNEIRVIQPQHEIVKYGITGVVTSTPGWQLSAAYFEGARFEQTGAKAWVEEGSKTFHFLELQRDGLSVILHDPSREVQIDINLGRNVIVFFQNGRRLYEQAIVQTKAAPLDDLPHQPPPPSPLGQPMEAALLQYAPQLAALPWFDPLRGAAVNRAYNGTTASDISFVSESAPVRVIKSAERPAGFGVPKSMTLAFGGGAGFFFGVEVAQGITFDLFPVERSNQYRYTGSTAVGGSLGEGFSGSAGAVLAVNFFSASEVAGPYWGIEATAVVGAGGSVGIFGTEAGPMIVAEISSGFDIGVALQGGYSFLEGKGTYIRS